VHTDEFRFPGNGFPALRETGVQVRGWWLDKKIGFRGGVYEGYAPILVNGTAQTAASPCPPSGVGCITPKRYPQFAGFVNFDIIGSEEGGWLYGAYKWGKDPILSVGFSGIYQAQAIRNVIGTSINNTNQRLFSGDVYLNLPMTEAAELVVEAVGYLNSNGTGNANTGTGFFADVGYRFGFVAPYASYSYFQAGDCNDLLLSNANTTACNTQVASANSRNFKAGLNFFFNKNLNHLNLEFQLNHGLSGYGPQSITAANAGYVPAGITTNLRTPTQKSFLAHWNVLF
jgi:hypothetical protein